MQIGIDVGATKIESVVLEDGGKEQHRLRIAWEIFLINRYTHGKKFNLFFDLDQISTFDKEAAYKTNLKNFWHKY